MRHRDPNDENWGFGWCRRKPPVIVEAIVKPLMPQLRYGQQIDPDMDALDMVSASKYPSTDATAWCGEFERATASQAVEGVR
jgi:hypothetical protein